MADERDDVEAAWARIVADYDREVDDPVGRWPAQEDVSEPAGGGTTSGRRRTDSPVHPLETGPPGDTNKGPDPPPVGESAEDEDEDEAEHHYVPPEPPPLGRPDLPTGLAWAGVLGSPVLLLLATALGWALPQLLIATCILGFIGGLIFLVATMDDGRGRDGWDDGAQV